MSVRSLAAGAVAGLAAVGAAVVGGSANAPARPVTAEIQPVVFGVPLPLDPAADLPAADQLSAVLYNLADAGVPFASKGGFVEGGIGPIEAHAADKRLQKAAQKGQLPLQFSVDNITPADPGAVTADVTVSGPQLEPRTMNIKFVDQGSWMLARTSAMTVLQMVSAG